MRSPRIAGMALIALAGTGALADDTPPGRRKAAACAVCHGALGLSTAPDAPHLAGQPRVYLVQQMRAFRSGRRAHEVMNLVAKPLTDADIDELAQWYSSLVVEVREPSQR